MIFLLWHNQIQLWLCMDGLRLDYFIKELSITMYLKKPWMQSADFERALGYKRQPSERGWGPWWSWSGSESFGEKKPCVIRPSRKLGSGSDLMEYSGINKGTTGRGSSALPNYNNPKMSSFFPFNIGQYNWDFDTLFTDLINKHCKLFLRGGMHIQIRSKSDLSQTTDLGLTFFLNTDPIPTKTTDSATLP